MPAAVTKNWALDELRYIPLSYDSADSETSALRICLTLYPEWKESEGPIEFIHFKDGITNTVRISPQLQCQWNLIFAALEGNQEEAQCQR